MIRTEYSCKILGRFATSPYYQQSVEALKRHELSCKLLGEPLRFQTLKLGNKQNWVTTEEAHVRYAQSESMHIFNLYTLLYAPFNNSLTTPAQCIPLSNRHIGTSHLVHFQEVIYIEALPLLESILVH